MKTIIAHLKGICVLLNGVFVILLFFQPIRAVQRVIFVPFLVLLFVEVLIILPFILVSMLVFCYFVLWFVYHFVCEAVSQLVSLHRARKMMKELDKMGAENPFEKARSLMEQARMRNALAEAKAQRQGYREQEAAQYLGKIAQAKARNQGERMISEYLKKELNDKNEQEKTCNR